MSIDIDTKRVEDNSALTDNVVCEIVSKYSNNLDKAMNCIRDVLSDSKTLTTEELERFVLKLPTDLYFISDLSEHVGIREDISKMLYREAYNNARGDYSGTVADKNAFAEIEASREQIANICYARAYRILKGKSDMGLELLSSCKKVLTRRITEMELTRISGDK